MIRYWVIAPYNATRIEIWEKVWQSDLKNNTIAIGWSELGDTSPYDEQQLINAIENAYTDRTKGFKTRSFNSVWRFYHEITEEKYNTLVRHTDGNNEAQDEFVLEKYLEEFIVSNFDRIFEGKLVLFTDDEGNVTQQYSTDVGKIDILAKEPQTDSFVVIELKKGRESDKVVGQTLRYMGWVKENLCTDNQQVKAIIICKEADIKLTYALKMTDNVELKHYSVDFKLIDK